MKEATTTRPAQRCEEGGQEPDKNDSQQSIRSITLYVTVVSRPQKITQPGIQCDIKLKYIKPTNLFSFKDESTFIH